MGQLLLTPAVPLENIKWYKVNSVDSSPPKNSVYELGEFTVSRDFGTMMFYIEPLKFPSVKSDSTKAMNPCFNVGKTTDLARANMEMILLEFGGYVFKCFRNVTDIKSDDELCIYAEVNPYKPFSSCTSVETSGEVKRRRLTQKTEDV